MRKIDAILVLCAICFCASLTPAADKFRLSDIPDEQDKRAEQKERKLEQRQQMTPEERNRVTRQLADEAYIDGIKAKRAGNLVEARNDFKKALTLIPEHAQARQELTWLNHKLHPFPTPTPAVAVKPVSEVKKVPPVRPTRPVVSAAEAKEKSEALYLKALTASQNGQYEEAQKFCREALKWDPDNLQAHRMAERLDTRLKGL